MPSTLPGFEYDIFISCRHKHNKGDRCLTDLVDTLKSAVTHLRSSTENKNVNQNRTDHRNLVNRITNAMKELISGLKNSVIQAAQAIEDSQQNQ